MNAQSAEVAKRNGLQVESWTHWGLPLVPALAIRKLLLLGKEEESQIISQGFDARNSAINHAMEILSRCELLPQKVLGTSLMATFRLERAAGAETYGNHPLDIDRLSRQG